MMGDCIVDINVASVEDLEKLVGVGRSKAEAIVSTRQSMVEFRSVDDLLSVTGIGKSLLEQNRGVIVCGIGSSAASKTPQNNNIAQGRNTPSRRSLRRASHDVRQSSQQSQPIVESSVDCFGKVANSPNDPSYPGCSASTSVSEAAGKQNSTELNIELTKSVKKNCNKTDEFHEKESKCSREIIEEDEEETEETLEDVGCSREEMDDRVDLDDDNDRINEGENSDYDCDCCLDDEDEVDDDIDEAIDDNEDNMSSDELIDAAPTVKSTNSVRSVDSRDNVCEGSGGGNNESDVCSRSGVHIRGGSEGSNFSPVVSGSSSSSLGTDTPHEDAPPDIPVELRLSSQHLTDGEDSEGEETEDNDQGHMEEDGEDNSMTVDPPSSPHTDKKHNKRKSEVCSDPKGSCPVKKSCKAVDDSGCSSSRRKPGLGCHKLNPPAGLKSWLAKYQTWTPTQKMHALDSLIDVCDLNQVRHIHQIILPQFQRDFISLLPKELALYVLSFLPPKDLLRAAQTCKYWNILAADNLLWREKCREAGIDDHMVVMDRRRKKGTCISHMSPFKVAFMRQHRIEMNWRVAALRPPRVLKGHDDHVITCLQFSGNTIVSGSDDNTLKVWNATTGKCMRTLTGHTGGVWSSQMSGNLIVSGSTDRMLRVWNAETGECIHTLYGHTSTVRCLHLHDNKVVSGSRDATLRVWDVTSGACEHVLVGHVAAVRCVQYNGRLVVSGAYDYMVKVWNPDREECLHTLQGHTNRVYSLQFDGIHVVSGSLDTSIRVWDVETGQCRHTLMGHQSLTSGMELKNNILISGNADSTVKVWDIVTGQCLQTLSGPNKHRSAVTCLQFNNKFVVTSSDDGTVKLWDVRTGEFLRNLVALESGGSGGVVWRIRASDTKLVCAVGSRNGTEETKLLVLDFDVYDTPK
ncbi:unnamed protein product [Meganyctiphanes norvegica]|uniref:F-box domain-containing protein n=1 Tax=Meganyctiphanes norvegica TaxID=48144 RepID=A0AAV2R7H1_MEGNR